MFHLIAYRGLRRGQAVGLRWQDADLAAGVLRITQQVVQLGWATEVREPKTDSGERRHARRRDVAGAAGLAVDSERQAGGVRRGLAAHRAHVHPRGRLAAAPRHGLERLRAAHPRGRPAAHSACTTSGTPQPASRSPPAYRSRSCPSSSATARWPSPRTPTRASCRPSRLLPPRRSPTSSPAAATRRRSHRSHPEPQEAPVRVKTTAPKANPEVREVLRGRPPGDRTPNPRIKSPLLCQLS